MMRRRRPPIYAWLAAGLLACLPGVLPVRAQGLFPGWSGSDGASALRHPRRTSSPPRPDTVPLPYNLVWGDNQQRLSSLFAGVGAQVTNKKTNGQLETWTVQGLIAPNLQASIFTFAQGMLAGVEFDYGQPDWTGAKYDEMMGKYEELLESKCVKPGEPIPPPPATSPPNPNFKQSLTGFRWSRGDTLVELIYFSVEDLAKSLTYRTISIHYYYQDPYAPPPGASPSPSPSPGSGGLFPNASAPPTSPDADGLPQH
jgi:hypothetical protein